MEQFYKNFEHYAQHLSKPLTAFAELNMEWAGKVANAAESFGDLLKAKKAEDVVEAHMNFAKKMNNCSMEYMQKATHIFSEASQEFMKEFSQEKKSGQK